MKLMVILIFRGEKGCIGNKGVHKTPSKLPKFHEVFKKAGEISVFYAVIVMIMTIILENLKEFNQNPNKHSTEI